MQNERLPLFLQSRLYAEYRLAKILSQVRLIRHDKTAVPDLYLSLTTLQEPPKVAISPIPEEAEDESSENMMENVHISFGDTSLSDIESWQNSFHERMFSQKRGSDSDLADVSESPNSEATTMFSSPNISPLPGTPPCILFADMDILRPEIGPPVYVGPYSKQADVPAVRILPPKRNRSSLHVNNLHELSQMLIALVVKNALVEVEGVSEEEVEESHIYNNLFPFYRKNSTSLTMELFKKFIHFDQPVDKTVDHIVLTDLFGYEKPANNDSSIVLSVDDEKEQHLENEYFDSGDQNSGCFSTVANIGEFQSFLNETSSEKNWYLWIDLEKFRLSKTDAGKET
ncbi:unnamed protein product [Acanthosepion pharaonis]|uniref:RGS domain-containing protein n=1 Tax=Acanthosepion pharaonis TaxID=158019 RepID=A0A812DXD8_ACAPH|nr:unnamed protein product [Sepia pharaonis]